VFTVRKLGVPEHEELAMGAIGSGGAYVLNYDVIDALHISREDVVDVAERERRELKRREHLYRDFNESRARRSRLRKTNVNCSMSGSGDCRNNAVVESFNGTIKRELINWNRWETRSAATMAIAEYIEGWYNLRRRHSEARVRSAPCSMSCEA
jgi:hypothetical protein